jgi:hypothetical protein
MDTGPATASRAAITPPGVRVLPAVRELRYRVLKRPGTSRSKKNVRDDFSMVHVKIATTLQINNVNRNSLRRHLREAQINLNKLLHDKNRQARAALCALGPESAPFTRFIVFYNGQWVPKSAVYISTLAWFPNSNWQIKVCKSLLNLFVANTSKVFCDSKDDHH